jgi:serine/threonine protein phosphatase PrpC
MAADSQEFPLIVTEADGRSSTHLVFQGGDLFLHSAPAPGKGRPNEDSAAVVAWGGTQGVLAVADGLGGQPGANQASGLLVRALGEMGQTPGNELGPTLEVTLDEVNRSIMDLGVGAGTTLALVEFSAGGLRSHHVGDSIVTLVDRDGLAKLHTIPHSPVGYAREAGVLTELEALRHPDLHVISNMVGSKSMRVERSDFLPWEPGDTLLVASDGLTDNMLTEEWVEILVSAEPRLAGPALVALAEERMAEGTDTIPGKPDDLTLILYRRN